MMHRMETPRQIHTPADGSGWDKRSHDKFDITLITAETTSISQGLLKPKGATYRTLLR